MRGGDGNHGDARLLAYKLGEGTAVRVETLETRIVMIEQVRDTDTADAVVPRLAAAGLLVAPYGSKRLRPMTHLDVARPDIECAAGNMWAVRQ